jgi:hypothetical protein
MKNVPLRIAGLASLAGEFVVSWSFLKIRGDRVGKQTGRRKVFLTAILCGGLATAATVEAQTSSTLRWWHNLDNGYSFGETLGVHPTFVVTGSRPEYEGYYDIGGPDFAKRIYINSANEAALDYGFAFPGSADVNHTPFKFIADTIVKEGGNTPPMTISGGTVVQCGDVPYHDGDGQIPNTDPDTNWVPTTYYIRFNSAPNTTDSDKKAGGDECDVARPAMARHSVHSMLVSLDIEDRPLRYTPPRGPAIDFVVTYNQREATVGAPFSSNNLGPKWTFNWLSYVTDDPVTQLPATSVNVPNGGSEAYAFDSISQAFVPHPQSHAMLVKTGSTTYERRLPDGSKQIYAQTDGATAYPRRIFMTQVVDPAGNSASVAYDTSFRITTLTDALGLISTLSYEDLGDPLKITKVTDPFGRFATFQYTSGQLTTITDEIGIQSQFTYTTGTDSIESLTTPYGTTQFSSGESGTNRWIEMTDPLGAKERVEYRDYAPGIASSDPIAPNAPGISNAGLDVANTFYWDKKAMAVAAGDYTKAKITHWLYNADGSLSGIPSSEKATLENRVW